MKRIPMTSDAEKLFDEIDSLRVRLQGLREMRKDLETKLNEIALEIGEVRLQLVARNDRFQQITESVAGTVPGPDADPRTRKLPASPVGGFLTSEKLQ
jgi:uncharacterized coiled-coil DUF342 family protein